MIGKTCPGGNSSKENATVFANFHLIVILIAYLTLLCYREQGTLCLSDTSCTCVHVADLIENFNEHTHCHLKTVPQGFKTEKQTTPRLHSFILYTRRK